MRLASFVPTALALVLTAATLAGPAAPAVGSTGPTIDVSPRTYIAGQTLTITGSIGRSGRVAVELQRDMSGHILNVKAGTTDASGHFRFTVPGMGMHGVPYLVSAPSLGVHTREFSVTPVPQEVTVSVPPVNGSDVHEAGQSLTIDAVATPARQGRGMTLQMRVGVDGWKTVAKSTEDAKGAATFELSSVDAGEQVYRVVAGNWHGIGWFGSFPEYVTITDPNTAPRPATDLPVNAPTALPRYVQPKAQPGWNNAQQAFGWGWPPAWLSDWEFGEPVTPWVDRSSGTGRVAIINAMMKLTSNANPMTRPTVGDVSATITKHAASTGRWETRIAGTSWHSGTAGTVRVELLPASDAAAPTCSSPRIVVAQFSTGKNGVTMGVVNKGSAWVHTEPAVKETSGWSQWHTYAVEVTGSHISWFIDGQVVSTLRVPKAYIGKPLAMRISLIGPSGLAQTTDIGVDWVRKFTMGKGNGRSLSAPAPQTSTAAKLLGTC